MPSDEFAEEAATAQKLLAKLCVQLESFGDAAARDILQDYTARLQASVEATRPAAELLQLPPELLGLVLRQLLASGAVAAVNTLFCTCKFFSAGVGRRLIVAECTRLCPDLGREYPDDFAGAAPPTLALLEFTSILLGSEIDRKAGFFDDVARVGMNGAPKDCMVHSSFFDSAALGLSLVQREAHTARACLTPLGFVVGEPMRHANDKGLNAFVRIHCAVPGVPGTLHDGALYPCDLIFGIGQDDETFSGMDADVLGLLEGHVCYPWSAPRTYVGGREPGPMYHMHLHGRPNSKFGYGGANCCSRLLNMDRGWRTSYCLTEVLLHLQYFLHSQNINDPGSSEPWQDATNNVPLFRQKTREWALSKQAPLGHPEPPPELVRAIYADEGPEDEAVRVRLGDEIYRVYRGGLLFTTPGDVVDRRLVERNQLPTMP